MIGKRGHIIMYVIALVMLVFAIGFCVAHIVCKAKGIDLGNRLILFQMDCLWLGAELRYNAEIYYDRNKD